MFARLLQSGVSALALCAILAGVAGAQASYPVRPVRLIVAYSPGGAGDIMARAMAEFLQQKLGQPVVVENKPGGSGMIGAQLVAKAKGDPHVLLLGSSAEMAINTSLYRSMTYDPKKDFVPIAMVGTLPLVLVSGPESAFSGLNDVLTEARRNPGRLTYASAGAGQLAHLGLEQLKREAGIDITHIPYKGGSEAVRAVLGGQVSLFLSGIPPAIPHISAGKLRPLAVSTAARVPQLPNVPTIAESGIPGFDIFNWFALYAPAGVDAAVITRLNGLVGEALTTPGIRSMWNQQGILVKEMNSDQLRAFMAGESAKYAQVVKAAGVKTE